MAILIDCITGDLNTDKDDILRNSIKSNLPANVKCLCNAEADGRKIGYCLLIEDIGIFIVESRNWKASDEINITSSKEVQITGADGNSYTEISPRWKAKAAQLALTGVLNEKYNIDPPVYCVVCYPELSQKEYVKKNLNLITEPEMTLFREDISDSSSFAGKLMAIQSELSFIKSDAMTDKTMSVCENFLSGKYEISEAENPYSLLGMYDSGISLAEIKRIIDLYMKGTKIFLFVKDQTSVESIAFQLTEQLNASEIKISGGDVNICREPENIIKINNGHFRIFNFEVYCSENFNFKGDHQIINGEADETEKKLLDSIADVVPFNIGQYSIEHAEINRDIFVKAGAGTGKTYSMVSRIAFLTINNIHSGVTRMDEEIAMLTFTKKAAANMKNRLKKLYMNYFALTKLPEYLELIINVENMQVSTIHSFSNTIISKTSIPIGIGTDFNTLSGVYERRKIFNRNFSEFLKKKNSEDPHYIYTLPMKVDQLQKKCLQMSEQLYNKGFDIKSVTIEAFGQPSEDYPDFNELIEDVIIKTEKEYSQMITEDNSVHLSEYMIYLKNSINSESFNANFYNFKYFFIDEFQDTDDAQIEAFLNMQKKIGFNLFIVGDLKQSIYRFRGSTMDAFSKMGCDSDEWLRFNLSINYRTDSELLEIYDRKFAEWGSRVIYNSRCMLPFVHGEDDLTGVKTNPMYDKKVEHFVTSEEELEDELMRKITFEEERISEIMEKKSLSESERTIAVLVRTNNQVKNVYNMAKKNGIILDTESVGDLYRIQPSVDLCKLTTALCNPYNITFLFDLINSNYIKARYNGLHKLRDKTDEEKLAILISYLDEFLMERLQRTWAQLISEVQTKPVLMMLRIIYENLQPWVNYSSKEDERQYYRRNYDLVFEELSDANNDSYISLEAINESLHINIETGTEKQSKSLIPENDGVRIICQTVHKAKGLEYGTVIMPYMDFPFVSSGGNTVGVSVEDGKIGYLISSYGNSITNDYYSEGTEDNESVMEETRILYVAMTRAINNFIYFTQHDVKQQTWGYIIGELS